MGNLTTLANVKTLIQISDSSQDSLLTLLIASVSSQIETYCGRLFGYADYDEILASNNRQLLQVAQWPIKQITFIKQSGNTLVAGQDYQTYFQYLNAGQIYRGQGWSGSSWVRGLTADPYAGDYIYEVSYSAGYVLPGATAPTPPPAVDPFPADIELAAMSMVAKAYSLSNSGNLGENLSSIKEGGLAYSWDNPAKIPPDLFQVIAGMPVQFAQLLNPYKRWVVA
jgi:hypothetical protein